MVLLLAIMEVRSEYSVLDRLICLTVLIGRQLDGAVASLEMLPEIVDAVGDKLTVLFDSGIRTGVDIMKALSLGAKAVLIGRPVIYGLAVGGKVCCDLELRNFHMLITCVARSKAGPSRSLGGSRSVDGPCWNL